MTESQQKVYVCPYCMRELQLQDNGHYTCKRCHRENIDINDRKAELDGEKYRNAVFSARGLKPDLELLRDGIDVSLDNNGYLIGSNPGLNGLQLPSESIEDIAAKVWIEKNADEERPYKWLLEKVGKDSVTLNDKEVSVPQELHDGDVVKFGGEKEILNVVIKYEIETDYHSNFNDTPIDIQSAEYSLLDKTRFYITDKDEGQHGDFVIPELPAFKVLIYKYKSSWWIYNIDCKSLKLNKKTIHHKELFLGDVITLYDSVQIKFYPDSLDLLKTYEEKNAEEELSIISVENLTAKKDDGTPLFSGISFNISSGQFFGILGLSGGGKTSIIHRLAGLAPYSGKIKVNNEDYSYRLDCAYLHQQPVLNETLTVKQECDCFALLHTTLSRSEIQVYIDSVLQMVGLFEKKDDQIHLLSGGEKKRLAIAMELLREPKILILDEPTSGLDPATETEIMGYLRRIADQGKIVICSTHMMGNINLFDQILFLRKEPNKGGVKDFIGNTKEALEHYKVDSFPDIYKKLSNYDINKPSANNEKDEFKEEEFKDRKPEYRLRQFVAYLKRDFYQLISFLYSQNWKQFIKNFVFGDLFFQLILQPFLIASVIRLSCIAKYFGHCIPTADEPGTVFFFSLISVFWLGMNNSIRELVSERVPGRCLERIRNIPLKVYLSSKMVWTAILSLVQTAIFCIILFDYFAPNFTYENMKMVLVWDWSYINTWCMFLILYFMCVLGAWIALAVSAICHRETVALSIMPLLLIPVLLFSYPVMQDDPKCNWGLTIEKYSPYLHPFKIMLELNESNFKIKQAENSLASSSAHSENNAATSNNVNRNNDKVHYSRNVNKTAKSSALPKYLFFQICWILIACIIMRIGQEVNERSWKGR